MSGLNDEAIKEIVTSEEFEEMQNQEEVFQKYLLIEQARELGVSFSKDDFSLEEVQVFTEIRIGIAKFRQGKHGKSETCL